MNSKKNSIRWTCLCLQTKQGWYLWCWLSAHNRKCCVETLLLGKLAWWMEISRCICLVLPLQSELEIIPFHTVGLIHTNQITGSPQQPSGSRHWFWLIERDHNARTNLITHKLLKLMRSNVKLRTDWPWNSSEEWRTRHTSRRAWQIWFMINHIKYMRSQTEQSRPSVSAMSTLPFRSPDPRCVPPCPSLDTTDGGVTDATGVLTHRWGPDPTELQ